MTRRLVLSYLAITVVVLLLLELPLAVVYQQREFDRLTADLERDTAVMATIYEDVLQEDLEPDPGAANDYAASTGARVIVVDLDGISIVDSARESDRDYSTRPEIAAALAGNRSTGTRRSDTLDTELLFVAVPVASGGTVHGAVRITFDAHEVTERVWRLWFGLMAIAAVVLLVVAGVGWILAGSVTRPVRRLQAAAERFSRGDLTPIETDSSAPPELVSLETGLNDMASRLDELIVRQRSFVADASHQLRTPLTALRLRLENLQSAASSGDSPADAAAARELDDAIAETTRLSELVNDLLRLARTENRTPPVHIDLTRLVHDRVSTWTATAEMHDIELSSDVDDAERLGLAIEGGIEQVLDNLIDNAIRVAPPLSRVAVAISSDDTQHTVSISDEGPGLSDADKRHALQRFWRSDTSTPGSGLGLAIAHAIVQSGGGTLSLHDNEPRGLVASFTVPLSTGAASAENSSRRQTSAAAPLR
jgi:signal transduction histidine kinase